MKIQTVSYEELISGDDYSNKRIGASCAIQENETPEDAFTNLVFWVKDQFFKIGVAPPALQEIENKIQEKELTLLQLQREVNEMRRVWKNAADFLEKHGVKIGDEIPF